METLLPELIKSSPSLVAVIVIVWIFVGYIRERALAEDKKDVIQHEVIRDLVKSSQEAHSQTTDRLETKLAEHMLVIQRNTEAMSTNSEVIRSWTKNAQK